MRLPFVLVALLSLGFVITIHELGHFTLCKLFGIDTPVFSIGFGPRIAQTKIGNTTFVIAALPFGGYVEIAGMDGFKKQITIPTRSFAQKPFYQKTLVLLGGIFFNFLAAYIIFLMLLLHTAWQASHISLSFLLHAFVRAWLVFTAAVKQAVHGFMPKTTAPTELAGPIRLLAFIVENVHSGLEVFLSTLAFMNISVGLFNLLPLPVLDGGRFVLISLETLRGKPFPPEIVSYLINASMVFLVFLIIYVSFRDIRRMQ